MDTEMFVDIGESLVCDAKKDILKVIHERQGRGESCHQLRDSFTNGEAYRKR